ncbi:MAG: EAL domain-containing protein [Anaerolineaceae bacterium]|nr:EAL domain-containing protein [Anaerolineaceae bacterium]
MNNTYWPYIVRLFPNIFLLFILGYLIILTIKKNLKFRWTKRFLLVLLTLMIWIIGDVLIQIAINPMLFNLSGKILFSGIVSVPYFWLLFVFSYSDHNNWLTSRRKFLLSIIPTLTLIIIYSDTLSPIMRVVTSIELHGNLIEYTVKYGPWFWVHTVSSYVMLLSGQILLVYSILYTSKIVAGQKILLSISAFFPLVANLLYLIGVTGNNDYTVFAFTILALAIGVNFKKFKFLDIGPIARGIVFENIVDPVIVLNVYDKIIDINTPAANIAQQDKINIVGQSFIDVFPKFNISLNKSRQCDKFTEDIGIPISQPKIFYSTQINKIKSKQSSWIGTVIVLRNITDQEIAKKTLLELNHELDKRVLMRTADLQKELEKNKKIQKALRESDERYAMVIQGANDGIWDWNVDTGTIFFSPRWKAMIGYADEEIPNTIDSWFEKVHKDDRSSLQIELSRHFDGETDHFEHTHRIFCKDGSDLWVLCRGLAKRNDEGLVFRMSGSMTDISRQKLYEEQILFDAIHDHLTDLPNRTFIIERISHAINRAKRSDNLLFALIFIDLDRFKMVNDSLGHEYGDQVLKISSKRLETCLRSVDTISRIGGDEFVVLIDSVADLDEVITVSNRIIQSFSEVMVLNENEVSISASLGVVVFCDEYDNAEEIIRDADIAMYQAKKNSHQQYEIFDTLMRQNLELRQKMESELRLALQYDQFELFYQPILHVKDLSLISFEALIRWRKSDTEFINPMDFIPIAEETGLIIPIGQWVIQEVCKQISDWKSVLPHGKNVMVSINVSAKQFSDPQLWAIVTKCLSDFQIEGNNLAIEITESIIIDEKENAIKMLGQLRGLGIQIYIDDFGTGYSSLSYLHTLPFDALKIDKSFINQMFSTDESTSIEIVQTIISLSKELRKKVIAEGVETQKELDMLNNIGCGYFQGYLESKPMDKIKASDYLAKEISNLKYASEQ